MEDGAGENEVDVWKTGDLLDRNAMTTMAECFAGVGTTEWRCTFSPKDFKGIRKQDTARGVLELLKNDRAKRGIGDADVGLVMPSTFHVIPEIHQKLPVGANMMMYVGAADLDCNSKEMGSDLLKTLIKGIINSGATLAELCSKCPAFGDATKAAQLFCSRLKDMGFDASSWFTGGKGYRVVWKDPRCYLKYLNKTDKEKGSLKFGPRIVSVFMKEYLGDECHTEIQKLCDIDKVTYTPGTGLKTDLFQHQVTGLWPVLVNLLDENDCGQMTMRRNEFDEVLGDKIIEFWTNVLQNIPLSWEDCAWVPDGGEKKGKDKRMRKENGPVQKRQRLKSSTSGTYEIALPENVVADLNTLLEATQKEGCVLKHTCVTDGKYYFRVNCENSGIRNCVVTPGETHTQNHAYLMCSNGRVSYWCHASTCNEKVDLGEIPESFVDFTGLEHCLEDSMETYEDMKQEFEISNCKILYPALIVHLNKEGEYVQSSVRGCKDSHGHLQCKVMMKGEWETKQFINIWLKDKHIRVFDSLKFAPPPMVCNKHDFNMWVPFAIANEPLVETERDFWKEYCQYLINLLDDEKIVNFLLARYAFRLGNPGLRTHVVLIISGLEGDGKNRMLAPLYNIMKGYTCALSSAKQLYEKHSTCELRKLFIMVSEAGGIANFENSEILKTRATEPTLHLNPKGVNMYDIDNFCDYDMTTNNQNVVKLTDDSRRRFLQIETTSYYRNNVAFFSDFIDNIENNPVALRQIYHGLMNFDYKAVVPSLNFQDIRYKPTTSVEGRVRQQNRDKMIWFFEDWVRVNIDSKGTDAVKYANDALFKMYITWCDSSMVQMNYNKVSFGMNLAVLAIKQLNTGGFTCIKKDSKHSTTTLYFSEFVRYFNHLNGFEFKKNNVDEDIETHSSMKRKEPQIVHSCNSTFCKECLYKVRRKNAVESKAVESKAWCMPNAAESKAWCMAKAAESKAAESKAAESKAAESKAAESKAAESKAAEFKAP